MPNLRPEGPEGAHVANLEGNGAVQGSPCSFSPLARGSKNGQFGSKVHKNQDFVKIMKFSPRAGESLIFKASGGQFIVPGLLRTTSAQKPAPTVPEVPPPSTLGGVPPPLLPPASWDELSGQSLAGAAE